MQLSNHTIILMALLALFLYFNGGAMLRGGG